MGKKKKTKKANKKSKKKSIKQATFTEVILAYNITLVEKKLEDIAYELKGWEDKVERAKTRNATLTEERDALANHMLKQVQEERLKPQDDMHSRQQVMVTLQSVWDRKNLRQKDIDNDEKAINDVGEEIEKVQREIRSWKKYRETQMNIDLLEIKLLEQELHDIEDTYFDMIDLLETDNQQIITKIIGKTSCVLEQQKDLAFEKAMSLLDKYSLQEVRDNAWLQKEVIDHELVKNHLEDEVNLLEKQNLEVMSDLFDCHIDDLNVYKNFFTTQIDETQDLENSSVLEMDLSRIDISAKLTSADLKKRSDEMFHKRPKSAMMKAIEDRIFPMLLNSVSDDSSYGEGGHSPTSQALSSPIHSICSPNGMLKPSDIETTMLSVIGHEVSLHPSSVSEDTHADTWPITQQMCINAMLSG